VGETPVGARGVPVENGAGGPEGTTVKKKKKGKAAPAIAPPPSDCSASYLGASHRGRASCSGRLPESAPASVPFGSPVGVPGGPAASLSQEGQEEEKGRGRGSWGGGARWRLGPAAAPPWPRGSSGRGTPGYTRGCCPSREVRR